jgi:hypothetical protein
MSFENWIFHSGLSDHDDGNMVIQAYNTNTIFLKSFSMLNHASPICLTVGLL